MWFEGVAPLFDKILRGGPLEHIGSAAWPHQSPLEGVARPSVRGGSSGDIINLSDLLTNVLTRKSLYKTEVLRTGWH